MIQKHRLNLSGIVFAIPAVALVGTFFLYPLIRVGVMSLQHYSVLGENAFVGLSNYRATLTDGEFWASLWNTVIYTAIVTPMIFLPAFFVAILLSSTSSTTVFLRTVFFVPVAISFVAASYIWIWIYQDSYGVLNYVLMKAGVLASPVHWLGRTWLARLMVSLMISWKTFGLSMIIIVAGLQGIPAEVYEAADIDGASPWQRLSRITLPLIRPTLLLALILSLAGSFKAFDQFVIMTSGGPMRSTQTVVMYINKLGFERYDLGHGAAVSVMFLILLLSLSYQQLRLGGYFDE